MDNAAANGHSHVVQWQHNERVDDCTLTAVNEAADNGHLDVVKWLHNIL